MIKFSQFELIKESLEAGDVSKAYAILEADGVDINEGVFTSIKNYLSKMLGGRVSKLDKLIRKYKDNEDDYWENWADGNAKQVRAVAALEELSAHDPEHRKYDEAKKMSERLLLQIEDTRSKVNASINKQSDLITKNNTRLTDYWNLAKAKADEDVANDALDQAKKGSDEHTINVLYDRLQKVVKEAKERDDAFSKSYGNAAKGKDDENSDSITDRLGIFQPDEIICQDYNDEDVKSELDNLSPEAKKKAEDRIKNLMRTINGKLQREMSSLEAKSKNAGESALRTISSDKAELSKTANKFIKNLERNQDHLQKISSTFNSKAKENITKDIKTNPDIVTPITKSELGPDKVEKVIDNTINQTLTDVKSPSTKDVNKTINDGVDKFFDTAKDTIDDDVKEVLDAQTYKHLKNDMIGLYGKLTFAYKGKDLKTLQFDVLRFAINIYDYKKKHKKLDVDLTDDELAKQFDDFNDSEEVEVRK